MSVATWSRPAADVTHDVRPAPRTCAHGAWQQAQSLPRLNSCLHLTSRIPTFQHKQTETILTVSQVNDISNVLALTFMFNRQTHPKSIIITIQGLFTESVLLHFVIPTIFITIARSRFYSAVDVFCYNIGTYLSRCLLKRRRMATNRRNRLYRYLISKITSNRSYDSRFAL